MDWKDKRVSTKPLPQPVMKRYWPGKAPVYANDDEEEEQEELIVDPHAVALLAKREEAFQEPEPPARRARREAVVIEAPDAAPAPVPRVKREPVVKADGSGSESESEEDEEAIAARRARARAKALAQAQAQEEALERVEEDVPMQDDAGSESSEYEYEDEEEEELNTQLLKPRFVPKEQRATIAERERQEAEEEERRARERERQQERVHESKALLVDTLKREEELKRLGLDEERDMSDEELPDTDDEEDAEKEYAMWKVRELKRIKREQDEKEAIKRDQEEMERRRNMSEEEKRLEDKQRKRDDDNAPRHKMKFMQKYFHKGAFYHDVEGAEELLKRNFNSATLEDKFDKSSMPKVMQVKNFGRMSQTKWTHLSNEDTTRRDDSWSEGDPNVKHLYLSKMAGMNASLERPRGKRKRE